MFVRCLAVDTFRKCTSRSWWVLLWRKMWNCWKAWCSETQWVVLHPPSLPPLIAYPGNLETRRRGRWSSHAKPICCQVSRSIFTVYICIYIYRRCSEVDKFLLTYVVLKLKLIRGKCIIFVNDVDRSYRLKLFLEQFSIKSCVLNSELPLNSR